MEMTPTGLRQYNANMFTDKEIDMVREYLLHILQYGSPDERINILKGIKSKFYLSQKRIFILE